MRQFSGLRNSESPKSLARKATAYMKENPCRLKVGTSLNALCLPGLMCFGEAVLRAGLPSTEDPSDTRLIHWGVVLGGGSSLSGHDESILVPRC